MLEKTRRGKATKIMAVAERSGLPVSVGIESGQRNEQKLVVGMLKKSFLRNELPKLLIGDKAYESDPLDEELVAMGIELIAPHHPRRRRKTQDGRKLRRYRRRWKVERLFSWIFRFRRLVTRYEEKPAIRLHAVEVPSKWRGHATPVRDERCPHRGANPIHRPLR